MPSQLPAIAATQVFSNSRAKAAIVYGDHRRGILSHRACLEARAQVATWPGYAVTPLRSLPGLAAATNVADLLYKDEGQRFGLGSFKALGGAYAVSRLLIREVKRHTKATSIDAADLISGRYRALTENITVTCATDGNHGRSVAWGAHLFGCRCVIYVHASVSVARKQAIARYGADVVTTQGHYDDAIRQAASDAADHGRQVVSDTSYEGYMEIPKDVMQGYTVMVDEIIEQLAMGWPPTHVFVQGGVGGLAAAVCTYFWERYEAQRPCFVVVEPDNADCIYQSIVHDKPTPSPGALDTVMAGLACGEISLLAWDILAEGANAIMTVDDRAAVACMRLLAKGIGDDPPIVAGESAVAGLAGFIGATQDPILRERLGISDTSRILLIGSEGDTDPELYQRLVGYSAGQVRAGAVATRQS